MFGEKVVEADLFGDHRLAFGHEFRVHRATDLEDDRARIGRRDGVVHMPALRDHPPLILLEIEIEVRQGVILDVACRIAQRVEFRQLVGNLFAAPDEIGLENLQRLLELAIRKRGVRVLLEARRCRGLAHDAPAVCCLGGAAMAGSPVIPASTSATCRTSMPAPSRARLPAMFIRQPRSPANSVPAPLARALATFLATMTLEISGYLTQNVPPNPQQTSASCISVRVNPATVASSLRGCAFTPSSRRPEQES